MTTILSFAFVIGVLVFVHELGHFLAARRIGVRVLKFSLGFGPRIVGFTRGDTEYCISAIPLGGYVKMAGENADDQRAGAPDEFLSKTKWERFQVLIMGPLMNLLLAVLLLAAVLLRGADLPAHLEQPPVVGSVGRGSIAEQAGIRAGDRVLAVGGRRVETWEDFFVALGARAFRETAITVARDGGEATLHVTADPKGRPEEGGIGVFPNVHPRVRAVNTGEPADRAGLRPGDVVLAVNGETVSFASQLSQAINKSPEIPLTLTIRRDGSPVEVRVTPARRGEVGLIGISIANEVKRVQPGPMRALWMSVERNWEYAGLILQTLWGLITGETSPKQLMGPVGIAQMSGEASQEGWVPLFALMASISLNLGLLNLLPIPVLDGGHILIMLLEGIARRDFSIRLKEKMLLAGFLVLMVLMVTVIYNDLTRVQWIENLMFWR